MRSVGLASDISVLDHARVCVLTTAGGAGGPSTHRTAPNPPPPPCMHAALHGCDALYRRAAERIRQEAAGAKLHVLHCDLSDLG